MSTSITIRNVPDETHDELVERAHRAGQSLQEYLLCELNSLAGKPDVAALIARVRAQTTPNQLTIEKILEYRDIGRK